MNDAELCRQAAEGDSKAWQAIMDRCGGAVKRIIRFRSRGERHLANDLEQDVWLAVFAKLKSFDAARGELDAWVSFLATDVVGRGWRSREDERKEVWIETPISAEDREEHYGPNDCGRPVTMLDCMASCDEPPDSGADRRERVTQAKRILHEAMRRMTKRQREAASLSLIYGLRDHEVAERMGISRERVRQLLCDVKRAIAEYKARGA
jgi:RNA polymerase sigma factor (sigma-70 family)